ncbi:MAG TPA: MATE family efflux transporter, partial [Anaerolineales bacterium]|nr:MATE family efflux transporter [Anaerolineales bacterium]
DVLLSYTLIFGKLGIPAMGVTGAAIGGLTARIYECVALISAVYITKSPIAGKLREIFNIDFHFFRKIFLPVLPVILNETFWSLGTTTYNAIYAHISTDSIAAVNIFSTIDQMALVLFFAITSGTSVMVGNRIGAGDKDTAYRYAGRSLGLVMVLAWAAGALIYSISGYLFVFFKVQPLVIEYAHHLLRISCSLLWVRAMNAMLIVSILRAGGDTWFAFFLDGCIIWILGVPMAYTGAFVLDLPVYGVYFMVMSEEVTKWSLGLYRFFSRKWINNLAQTV